MAMRLALMTAMLVFVSLAGDARAQGGRDVCSTMCNCDIQCIDLCSAPCTSRCAQQATKLRLACQKNCNTCNTLRQRKATGEKNYSK